MLERPPVHVGEGFDAAAKLVEDRGLERGDVPAGEGIPLEIEKLPLAGSLIDRDGPVMRDDPATAARAVDDVSVTLLDRDRGVHETMPRERSALADPEHLEGRRRQVHVARHALE